MVLTFNDTEYSRFLNEKTVIHNSRLRDDNETFFDAMLSKEADLRTTAEGRQIIKFIQAIGDE